MPALVGHPSSEGAYSEFELGDNGFLWIELENCSHVVVGFAPLGQGYGSSCAHCAALKEVRLLDIHLCRDKYQ